MRPNWSRPTIPPRERDNAAMDKTAMLKALLTARLLSYGSEGLPKWLADLCGEWWPNTTDKTALLLVVMRENFPREVMAQVREVMA